LGKLESKNLSVCNNWPHITDGKCNKSSLANSGSKSCWCAYTSMLLIY